MADKHNQGHCLLMRNKEPNLDPVMRDYFVDIHSFWGKLKFASLVDNPATQIKSVIIKAYM